METTKVSFTAKDVMALREKTGQGMMDCKKALTENNGDAEAAVEWLRERLKGKMDTRTERTTGEGRIGIARNDAGAVIVEVLTETDFTAKNEAFVAMVDDVTKEALKQSAGPISATDAIAARIDDVRLTTRENVNLARGEKLEGGHYGSYVHHDGKRGCLLEFSGAVDADLAKGICQHIVALDPAAVDEDGVDKAHLESIRSEAIEEAKASGKNDEIAQKIADGKVRKYLEENTLVHQKFVLDDSKSVKELLPGGVSIKRFIRYTLGG